MAEYETLRQKHVADATELLPEHIQRVDWPAKRLADARENRLCELVRTVKETSAWHRERLADVEPDMLREKDLAALPVMTKDDLMGNWDQIVTDQRLTLDLVEAHIENLTSDAYLLDRYHAVASGGSSGRRGVFVFDWDAWTLCYVAALRWNARRMMRGTDPSAAPMIIASVSAQSATHKTSAIAQTFSNPALPIHHVSISLPTEQMVAELNELQPTMLMGYPSVMFELTHEERRGNLRISPSAVTSNSEPLLPEMRAAFEETWSASVGNMWGTSEGGITGLSCGEGAGMHLSDDLLIIELVDDNGQPVPPGVRAAKVYLTNFHQLTLPLIRYEITDEVTMLTDPCPCGSIFQRVEDIQGRQDDSFAYAQGLTVHPTVFRSPLGQERSIIEYQVRQTRNGADIAIRCAAEVDMSDLADHIAEALSALGLENPAVNVTQVEGFERTAAGKLKRFIPLS